MKQREILELGLSWLTISAAFSVLYSNLQLGNFLLFAPIALLAVGTGFILHELAHKYSAIRFGAHAEYIAWPWGLVLTLLVPLITAGQFLFAVTGAVYIFGEVTKKQNGLISLAGPVTNLVLGLLFLALAPMVPGQYLRFGLWMSANINFYLAFFNLLPIPPLDGSKVIAWNLPVWGLSILVSAGLAFGLLQPF